MLFYYYRKKYFEHLLLNVIVQSSFEYLFIYFENKLIYALLPRSPKSSIFSISKYFIPLLLFILIISIDCLTLDIIFLFLVLESKKIKS